MPTTSVNLRAFFGVGLPTLGSSATFGQLLISAIVQAALTDRWWVDEAGMRYSLTKAEAFTPVYCVAMLAQQHDLSRHLYDDEKRETRAALDSYEDRLVVFDLIEGRVIIEWRQFRQKPPLSLPMTVRRIEKVLADLLLEVMDTDQVQLIPFELRTSKAEFIALFYGNRVLELEVENFAAQPVAEEIVLVNPIPPLEGALRELLTHDLQLNTIGKVSAAARDSPTADLKRAAVARAMIHSGVPTRVKYESSSGYVRVRRESENGMVSVSVPVRGDDSPEDRALIAEKAIAALGGIDLTSAPSQLPSARGNPTNLDLFNAE